MDLRKLRYFVAAAMEQNFHRAAELSFVTQPALSKQIALLEDELCCQLFIRAKRRVKLSPVGEAFLIDAQRILREVDFAIERVARASAGQTGILRVGFRETAGRSPLVSKIFSRFKEEYPAVELNLTQMTVDQVCEDLLREILHIGLSYSPPRKYRGLASLPIESERMYIAMPSSHRLAKKDEVSVKDLIDEQFIWFSRARPAYYLDLMMQRLVKAGGMLNIVQEADNEAAMLNFVSLGLGVCPALAVSQSVAPRGIVYMPVAELEDPIKLEFIWLQRSESPMTKNFLNIARSLVTS